jgi:hypothetical protein
MSTTSALRIWSKGVAASNKALNTDELSVIPYEVTPTLDGELDDSISEQVMEGKDAFGVSYSVKVQTSAAIVAKWLPFGDRSTTAPDIRRGERVVIYRFADSNDYYWVDEGLDRHLRRLETIIYRVAATPEDLKSETVELTEDNCYFLTISTHEGLISFTTSKANGEPYAWTFQFDTKNGVWTVGDDSGNYIQINPNEPLIHLQNANGTFVKLNRENIEGYAPQNIDLKAVQQILMQCQSFTLTADDSATINTPTLQCNVDQSNFTGNVSVGGDVSVAGNVTVAGTISSKKASIGGVTIENGVMQCKSITASSPIQAPNV